jgi:benzodiazapine receptor
MTRTTPAWAGNILAFALTIVVNGLATSIPLGGQTPPEISAKYPSLFTPAGFTFSIWGIIYLGLMLFIIYQALPAQRSSAVLAKIDGLFKLSCAANAAWILSWHYEYLLLSIGIMACLLFSLVGIYRALQASTGVASIAQRLLVHLPFSLYTAWISVATIANISAVQTGYGWDNIGMDAISWTLLKLALAGAIGATVIARKADMAFVLVIAWAAYGISVMQADTAAVSGAATALVLLALILVVFELARRVMAKVQ